MALSLISTSRPPLDWARRWLSLSLLVCFGGGSFLHAEGTAQAAWFARLPSENSLAEVRAMAVREGWQKVADAVFQGAKQAYLQDRLDLAGAWLNVARWGGLFAEVESHFI